MSEAAPKAEADVRPARRICLVSGGTGGHLMPALVLGRALLEAGQAPLLITEGREVERELVDRELPDIEAVEVPRSGRSPLALPVWLLRATRTARGMLRRHDAGGVISTGGRASVPVALAARSLGLPVFLLEQNAVTGRANRWLRSISRRMYTGLPGAEVDGRRALHTGTPLRPGFGSIDRRAARAALGSRDGVPVVLVTGGSQGARALNELAPDALVGVGRELQVVHLCGLGNEAAVRARYECAAGLTVDVREVALDMDLLFAAADLVVCRGGGTTVAELMAVGRPAVVVPYPHHKDQQQLHNARVLERVGAAVVCEERSVDLARFTSTLSELLADPAKLGAMGDAARAIRRLDACDAILGDVTAELTSVPMREPQAVSSRQPRRRGGVA
ncbi:MAG: UDP-N-acetylglucosamine--N-acetylmuramyl-(pentapeptide) pyrophosphoryl-undecaprenol N-acetylglucosamine transferase [Planctomycetota bacterium]|nr:UDP-N-acetylglucosamine--N-acetylmuramyl-(pentapeptide) pyrophosphoryl-undecaprenol N-acetylglucosamine transferase [Planctomycetota bacterium]